MNKRIRSLIDTLFCEMKMSAENLALRDELMANAIDRFNDAVAQGKTEEEAFALVAASLEDVGDLLAEMNAASQEGPAQQTTESENEEPQEPAGEYIPQTDLGDALNKAFSALESFGQSIMPQAKKIVRQMDDATGGMLSDIGRAVNKGMQDAQKAAEEVFDRCQQQQEAEDAAFEKTADDLREEEKDLRAMAQLKKAAGDEAGAQELLDQADQLAARILAMENAVQNPPPIYGADGELNEDAFVKSVDDLTRDAQKIIDEDTSIPHSAAKNELRFCAAGLRKITATLDADDVMLGPAEGSDVIVRWSDMGADNEPEVSFDNHTLNIRRKNPDVFKTFFSVFNKNGGAITILVPKGYAADYSLSATSGDIQLSELDAAEVKISTTSGSIRVETDLSRRVACVKAESISGSITVSAVAEAIDAKSVSGNIFISCDAASVKGDVVSGQLHAEGACDDWDINAVSGKAELICTVAPTGKVAVDTLSGSLTLFLPGNIRGFAVDFTTMSGSLTNEFGPNRFGTCALPIRLNTLSGSAIIARL